MKKKLTASQNFIRSFAVVIPTMVLGSYLLKSTPMLFIGIVFSYFLTFVFAQFIRLKSVMHSLLVNFIICYAFSCVKMIQAVMADKLSVWSNLYKIFISSGIISVVTFGIFIPSWLIFWGLDALIVRSFTDKSKPPKIMQ